MDHRSHKGIHYFFIVWKHEQGKWVLNKQRFILNVCDYNNKEKFSKTELIKFKEKWSPWCSIATWYMWRSLDPIPVEY